MKSYTIDAILKGVREKDNKVLHYIYQENYPAIKKHIIDNNGYPQDAKDIFQDAIVIIYEQSKKRELDLDCSFSTYLYSICKILWLRELKKKRKERTDKIELEDFLNVQDIIGSYDETERYANYHKHIINLGYNCQKILRLFYDGVPLKEIARIMGYKNEDIVKSKKFTCKEKLLKWIRNDPDLQNRRKGEEKMRR